MSDTLLQPDLPSESVPAIERAAGPSEAEAGGVLTINLSAISANWIALGRQAMPAECAAVVKADGYGCGIEAVARSLNRTRRPLRSSFSSGSNL